MISRFVGGILGLLAFTVATVVGLVAGNPPTVILSRALWALVVFCLIGLVVGVAAQMVINEYMSQEESRLFPDDGLSGESSKKGTSSVADSMADSVADPQAMGVE